MKFLFSLTCLALFLYSTHAVTGLEKLYFLRTTAGTVIGIYGGKPVKGAALVAMNPQFFFSPHMLWYFDNERIFSAGCTSEKYVISPLVQIAKDGALSDTSKADDGPVTVVPYQDNCRYQKYVANGNLFSFPAVNQQLYLPPLTENGESSVLKRSCSKGTELEPYQYIECLFFIYDPFTDMVLKKKPGSSEIVAVKFDKNRNLLKESLESLWYLFPDAFNVFCSAVDGTVLNIILPKVDDPDSEEATEAAVNTEAIDEKDANKYALYMGPDSFGVNCVSIVSPATSTCVPVTASSSSMIPDTRKRWIKLPLKEIVDDSTWKENIKRYQEDAKREAAKRLCASIPSSPEKSSCDAVPFPVLYKALTDQPSTTKGSPIKVDVEGTPMTPSDDGVIVLPENFPKRSCSILQSLR